MRNAKEAIFVAQMAREALGTNWLKLEIHPDPKYLMPDPIETLLATQELVKDGFGVLPIAMLIQFYVRGLKTQEPRSYATWLTNCVTAGWKAVNFCV